ncbi:MAG: sulfatase [Paludibacter sp.]|jgi:N-sulfoglucosamine sulfohydrolase|nr:sulfatase [Paludibacter sp.]
MFKSITLGAGLAISSLTQLNARTEISQKKADKPNIVVFTVDDMDISSVNCYGNPLPGLTPNMDKLASQSVIFKNAHVSSAISMPCRQSMMTGLHAHRNGSMGFIEVEKGACPSLSGILMENGYYTASIGKGRDYKAFPWSEFQDDGWKWPGDGWYSRNPEFFYQKAKTAIQHARKTGQPIYLGVNTSDPHRPFPGSEQEKEFVAKLRVNNPDAVDYPVMKPFCTPDEAPLLHYLPDLPDIRTEMAQYYTAVHRADNTLGRIMQLLKEEGIADNTLVIFFSDHDAAMPSAKQNCYVHSSVTPLMISWPEKFKPSIVKHQMVSTLDLMPTILEALHLPIPQKQDGRSMLPILNGKKQKDRNAVFTTYNYISPGIQVFPMRAVHTLEWSYVYNPWSDGIKKRLQESGKPTENQSGLTFAAIQKAAITDSLIKKRLDYILLRRREELFDLKTDPFSMKNLAEDPKYKKQLISMRNLLIKEMRRTDDPLLNSLVNNESYPTEWNKR